MPTKSMPTKKTPTYNSQSTNTDNGTFSVSGNKETATLDKTVDKKLFSIVACCLAIGVILILILCWFAMTVYRDNAKFKAENEALLQRNFELNSTIEILKNDKAKLSDQAVSLQNELSREQDRSALLKSDVGYLRNQVENLTSKLVEESRNSKLIRSKEEGASESQPQTHITESDGLISDIKNFLWSAVEKDVAILRSEFKKETEKFHAPPHKTTSRFKPDEHLYSSENHHEGYGPSGPVSLAPDAKNEFYSLLLI